MLTNQMRKAARRIPVPLRWALLGIGLVVAIVALTIFGPEWVGFSAYTTPISTTSDYHPAKSLWDWFGLLVIPAVLALVGVGFSNAQRRNDRNIEDTRLRDAALREYLDRMSDLLLTHKLQTSAEVDPVRYVARARTLEILEALDSDGSRKGRVVRFVYESGLIKTDTAILSLHRANLFGADLFIAHLKEANLYLANLTEADLIGAQLAGANLTGANLTRANLTGADLTGANLTIADLTGANLLGANLTGADLPLADLSGANLTIADLTGANLGDAKVSDSQLAQASSLKGAMMPDRTVHD